MISSHVYQPFTVISSGKIIIHFGHTRFVHGNSCTYTWWATATIVHIVWDDSLLKCVRIIQYLV